MNLIIIHVMGQGLCHLSRWQRRNHGGEQRAKYILLHLFSMPILTHTTLVKVAFRFSDSLILSLLRSSMSLKWLLTRKTRDSWNWCLDYSTETGRQRTPPPPTRSRNNDKVNRGRPEWHPIQIPTVAKPAKGQEHRGSCTAVTSSLPDALEF